MKNSVRLKLLMQGLKGTDKSIKALVNEATELAIQTFGINTPILFDATKPTPIIDEKRTTIDGLANYDVFNDVVNFFYNKLKYYTKLYEVDIKASINFIICHEFGHVKQGRIDENYGYYSYTAKLLPIEYPVTIQDKIYDISNFHISNFAFPSIFINGISDCAINNELKKKGLYDPIFAKSFNYALSKTMNVGPNSWSETDLHIAVLERHLLLPLTIDNYLNKNLDEEAKALLESNYRPYVGKKWDYALETMKTLQVGNTENIMKVVSDLLSKVWGVEGFYNNLFDFLIFKPGKPRPIFYNKKSYKVLCLTGSYPNKIFPPDC